MFQATDGYCVCAPGHEFVDDAFIKRSEEDGVQACQPIVYAYCVSGQTRAADGSCITAGECAKCPDGTGTLIPRTGLCECSGLPTLEDVCNAECRRAAPVVSVDPSGNGSLVIAQTDTVTGVIERVSIPLASLIGLVGTVSCSSPIALAASLSSTTIAVGPGGIPLDASAALSGCRLVTLSTSSGGIGGTYDLAGPLLDAILAQQLRRRRLEADGIHTTDVSRVLHLYDAWKQRHQAPLAAAHAAANRKRHLIVVGDTTRIFVGTFVGKWLCGRFYGLCVRHRLHSTTLVLPRIFACVELRICVDCRRPTLPYPYFSLLFVFKRVTPCCLIWARTSPRFLCTTRTRC